MRMMSFSFPWSDGLQLWIWHSAAQILAWLREHFQRPKGQGTRVGPMAAETSALGLAMRFVPSKLQHRFNQQIKLYWSDKAAIFRSVLQE